MQLQSPPRQGCFGCLGKALLILGLGVVAAWLIMAALNTWALHIGGQSTPLLYWHGTGTVISKDGRRYPLYLSFGPGKPSGFSGGGRREGKLKTASLTGRAWLCVTTGRDVRMEISGSKFDGLTSTGGSLFSFRLLEWRGPLAIGPPRRGYFDIAGEFHGSELVLDRSDEQGIRLTAGPFIDHARASLKFRPASRDIFHV